MALTGTFEELTNLFIFATWIFYGSRRCLLFRLRKTEPKHGSSLPLPGLSDRPWSLRRRRARSYHQRPLPKSRPLLVGLLLILLGLPFFRYWQRKPATV